MNWNGSSTQSLRLASTTSAWAMIRIGFLPEGWAAGHRAKKA
jgi:hypothetical protein